MVAPCPECERLERELAAARAEIGRLLTAGESVLLTAAALAADGLADPAKLRTAAQTPRATVTLGASFAFDYPAQLAALKDAIQKRPPSC